MRCWWSYILVMMKMMLNVSFVSFFLFSDFFMLLESEKDDFQKRENRNLLQLSPSFFTKDTSLFLFIYFELLQPLTHSAGENEPWSLQHFSLHAHTALWMQ